ncbi:MAG: TfoX/Sxy family protein [Thermodesulfobacteriota bacterium]
MAWKKVSPQQAHLLEKALEKFDQEKRPMFGCPAYFVHGQWFAGVHEDNILVKLDEQGRNQIFAQYPEAALFEPFPGRTMKEFVVLPAAVIENETEFEGWLRRAYDYARSRPPKEKKTRNRKSC